MPSRKQLALVHIAKKQLGLTEEGYRAILHQLGGVDSSKDLDQVGFELVMQYMVDLGFRSGFTASSTAIAPAWRPRRRSRSSANCGMSIPAAQARTSRSASGSLAPSKPRRFASSPARKARKPSLRSRR